MYLLRHFLLLSVGLLLISSAQALVIVNSDSAGYQCNASGSSCFELRIVNDPNYNNISWGTAQDNAMLLGGNLATPDSNAENDILLALLAVAPGAWGNVQFGGISTGGWIGVLNLLDAWVNLDGSDALESGDKLYPWYTGSEPNGPLPSDAYVAFVNVTASNQFNLAEGVGWADLQEWSSFFRTPSFFVEYKVPEPATLILFALGWLGIRATRKKPLLC